jgi:hypothetical protein
MRSEVYEDAIKTSGFGVECGPAFSRAGPLRCSRTPLRQAREARTSLAAGLVTLPRNHYLLSDGIQFR